MRASPLVRSSAEPASAPSCSMVEAERMGTTQASPPAR
jgi:hypothetical protein